MTSSLTDAVCVRLASNKRLLLVLWMALFASVSQDGRAGDAAFIRTSQGPIAKYRSGRLELQTDLRKQDAMELLQRLETTLRTVSRYWRRPCDRRIVFFVVDDLANWPDSALPSPHARTVLKHIQGGMELPASPGGQKAVEAHVYATSARGIAEHELVHAYCMLVFGTCGPDWYKEGMAEMAYYQSGGRRAVQCQGSVARLLRADRRRPIREIVHAGQFTGPLAEKFKKAGETRPGEAAAPIDWQAKDDDLVRKARESYHRSWALCYFLANHPSYRDRFRQLGIGFLNGTEVDFDQMFAPVADRLSFEFALFLRDIDAGYRVDLCHWDWDGEFAPLAEGDSKVARVLAARGYQASGLLVADGQRYDYVADGWWKFCSRRPESTADGSYLGHGNLEGVILADYDLGKPVELGASGSFVASRSGKLYLRCRDDWNGLEDNRGAVEVRLMLSKEPDTAK